MDKTPKKSPAFYPPKKVYTYHMQQQREREAQSLKAAETDTDVTTSTNKPTNMGANAKLETSLMRAGGRGEKKLPLFSNEEDDKLSSSNSVLAVPDRCEVSSRGSRGKTGKHLNLLAYQERLSKQASEEEVQADTSRSPQQEGSKRVSGLHRGEGPAKRPCEKKHYSGKDMDVLMATQSHVVTEQRPAYQGGYHLTRRGSDGDGCTVTMASTSQSSPDVDMSHQAGSVTRGPGRPRRQHVEPQPRTLRRQPSGMCNEITSSENPARQEDSETSAGLVKRSRSVVEPSSSRVKVEADSNNLHATASTSKLSEQQNCMVCGDIAAGFHCGAYVCEACKKFFVRCLKQEVGNKFVCSRNKSCVVNRETRTQCQHCRYQKCISLGMYKPGSGPGGGKFGAEISHIPCKVCESPSSGYHFGAITCEGCKGFFRRTVKERSGVRYVCSRKGACNITVNTRNVCKYCRYQKCLQAGMTPDGSRIGRQPNAVKHATMLELQRLHTEDSALPDIQELKKEALSPPSESPDGVFPDNAQFELIDPSNLPEDLYLPQNEDDQGKLPEVPQSQPHEDKDVIARHSEPESLSIFKPSFSNPQNFGILQEDSEFGTTYYNDIQNTRDTLPQDGGVQQGGMSDYRRRNEPNEGLAHQSVDRYAHEEIMEGGHRIMSPTLLRQPQVPENTNSAVLERLAYEEHVNMLEYQHKQELNRIEALQEEQQRLKLQAQQTAEKLETFREIKLQEHWRHVNHHPIVEQQRESASARDFMGERLHAEDVHREVMSIDDTRVDHNMTDSGRFCPTSESEPYNVPKYVQPGLSDAREARHDHLESTVSISNNKDFAYLPTPSAPVERPFTVETDQGRGSESPQDMPENLSSIKSHNACVSGIGKMTSQMKTMQETVTHASLFLKPVLVKNTNCKGISRGTSTEEMWETMMSQFHQCAASVIKFARRVPGFNVFPLEEQMEKVQMSMYPIVLAVLSTQYDIKTEAYNYFHMSVEERNIIFEYFPGFQVLQDHFRHIGHSIKFKDLDGIEIAFLCSILLMTSDPQGKGCKNLHQDKVTDLMEALHFYCTEKQETDDGRDVYILARLAELNRCNTEHQRAVQQLLTDYPSLFIPQLYTETYLNA